MPGVDGPAVESLIACQPRAASTCSDSNHSRRYCVADVPNRKVASAISDRWRAAIPPSFASLASSRGRRLRGSGGVVSMSGVIRPAMLRQLLLEGGEGPRVRRGELLELALGGGQVVVEEERGAVGPQVQRGPGRIDRDPALDQP